MKSLVDTSTAADFYSESMISTETIILTLRLMTKNMPPGCRTGPYRRISGGPAGRRLICAAPRRLIM